ncbi:hypothetical protein MBLNU459_g3785t1 [Dothideomycetes sp. NU459]
MPRPRNESGAEPKKRSRNGCWPCKARKVKCGEEKPHCVNCVKQGEECDYSIRLQWGGRSKKEQDAFSAIASPYSFAASSGPATPVVPSARATVTQPPLARAPSQGAGHDNSTTSFMIDPQLASLSNAPQSGHMQGAVWQDSAQISRNQHAGSFPDLDLPYNPLPQLPPPGPHHAGQAATDGSLQNYAFAHSIQYPPADFAWSQQHGVKRKRLSPTGSPRPTLPSVFARPELPDGATSHNSQHEQQSPGSTLFTPHSIGSALNTPLTPGSSAASEEISGRNPSRTHGQRRRHSPGVRRLSVQSLLSGPSGDHPNAANRRALHYPKVDIDGATIYGYDHGLPDLDIPKNNDAVAISPQSPATVRSEMSSPFAVASATPSPVQPKDTAFERGGYYAQPVPIKIPKELEPLPEYLTESPMNLLYFHHFLNHTARILVPHDCPDNPLKSILPRIAVQNANLLNLLLAYSSSHRARLLNHPEPSNRIALWVRDVFPDLRHALSSNEPITDATLATAIMLASREIITPSTFDIKIPWQNHLGIARQMIIFRGGLKDMGSVGNPFINFLARWFAYLDVIGSLSGYKNDAPLSEAYRSFGDDAPDDKGFGIDCFFGFTNCCISLLARVAKLAHQCDAERIDSQGNIDSAWQPSLETRDSAEKLRQDLASSREHVHKGCRHSESTGETEEDVQEIVSVNEAFHLAGLIHLNRRVLGKPSSDPEVQSCVRQVLAALTQIRKGGTAESCLLFPMFTAGCDAEEQEHRDMILERLTLVEGLGMTHVQKARTLMQTSWETGKPWETLVSGEFFG